MDSEKLMFVDMFQTFHERLYFDIICCTKLKLTNIFRYRNRHELAEKIRELTRGTITKKENRKWEKSYNLVVKQEERHNAQIIIQPKNKASITTLYQPVFHSYRKHNQKLVFVFEVPEIEVRRKKSSEDRKEQSSDRKRKQKQKKRRSSTVSRIEEILSKGKNALLLPEPSEESLSSDTPEESPKRKRIYINDLSDDILQEVFWYFSLKQRCTTLALVCKRWYEITKNPIFWRELDFKDHRVSTRVIMNLIHQSSLLRSLKLTRVPDAAIILHELCREKNELTELHIKFCHMNKIDAVHALLGIVSSLPRLEILNMEGTEFQSMRFFTELCLLKNLRSLNLSSNKYLQPTRDLMTISMNCPRLESLEVLDIPSGIEHGWKMTDENFSFILGNLRDTLQELKFDMHHLKNTAYLAIIKCKKLQVLYLTNCIHLTGDMFRKFNQLNNLKSLTLTRAINLHSEDIQQAFEGRKMNLEEFGLNGCWRLEEWGVRAIAKGLPSVKRLSLENCKSVKAHHLEAMSVCPNLDTLNIARTGVDPKHLPALFEFSRNLRNLTIDENMYEVAVSGNVNIPRRRVTVAKNSLKF